MRPGREIAIGTLLVATAACHREAAKPAPGPTAASKAAVAPGLVHVPPSLAGQGLGMSMTDRLRARLGGRRVVYEQGHDTTGRRSPSAELRAQRDGARSLDAQLRELHKTPQPRSSPAADTAGPH